MAAASEVGGSTPGRKGHAKAALDRLHVRGMIHDPTSKAKSIALADQGAQQSRELFERHFGAQAPSSYTM